MKNRLQKRDKRLKMREKLKKLTIIRRQRRSQRLKKKIRKT